MRAFALDQPTALGEATDILANDEDALPLAGGTALVVMLRHRLISPTRLVSLERIPDLYGIRADAEGGGLWIGANTPIQEVATADAVRARYPLLAEACRSVANIRIRNLATIGGNLAHADPASDPPTALATLGATIDVLGTAGPRRVPIDEFLRGTYETVLQPGELVRGIALPPPVPGASGAYVKFTDRQSEDRPLVSVGMACVVEDEVFRSLDIVIGAAFAIPMRLTATQRSAKGRSVDPVALEMLADAAAAEVSQGGDAATDTAHLVRTLVRRTLVACVGSRPS